SGAFQQGALYSAARGNDVPRGRDPRPIRRKPPGGRAPPEDDEAGGTRFSPDRSRSQGSGSHAGEPSGGAQKALRAHAGWSEGGRAAPEGEGCVARGREASGPDPSSGDGKPGGIRGPA